MLFDIHVYVQVYVKDGGSTMCLEKIPDCHLAEGVPQP